jgi:MFS family permease
MEQPNVSPRFAWFVLGLLTLLNVLNFVDRQLVVSLQVPLKAERTLQLDDTKITLLAGYTFAIVYSIAGVYFGTIADRWHRPRLIAMGLLVWSVMTAASGLAQSFSQLALARIFVAIGESTLTPAAIAILGDAFSSKQRSLASGLYYLGIPLGASMSMIVASLLEPIPGIGWRGCYLILGSAGALLVIVVALVPDPRQMIAKAIDSPATTTQPNSPSLFSQIREVFRVLYHSPALVLTIAGALPINIAVGTMWLDPSWLVIERGFDKSKATMFLGVLFLFGGSLGNFLGGWLGDVFHRRFVGGRLIALILMQMTVAPFSIMFRFISPDSILFPIGYLVGSIFVTMMYGPVLATVHELTPARIRATMIAFLLICLNIFGASLGSLLAARLTKSFDSYTWGIFATSQISWIAIPLFLLAARRFRRDQHVV